MQKDKRTSPSTIVMDFFIDMPRSAKVFDLAENRPKVSQGFQGDLRSLAAQVRPQRGAPRRPCASEACKILHAIIRWIAIRVCHASMTNSTSRAGMQPVQW